MPLPARSGSGAACRQSYGGQATLTIQGRLAHGALFQDTTLIQVLGKNARQE